MRSHDSYESAGCVVLGMALLFNIALVGLTIAALVLGVIWLAREVL